jgi:uncharacterized protein YebE (UPF0316 family)
MTPNGRPQFFAQTRLIRRKTGILESPPDPTMDPHTFLTGLIIFLARICDVSLGTIRTIVIVQGRTIVAFFLGLIEVVIWITIVSTVVHSIKETPILVLFYSLGFATGNVVGIMAERKLAFGLIILRVITRRKEGPIADRLRKLGQAVTVFRGEGMRGPVSELYIACRRRDLKWILPIVREEDDTAFYITEQARDVSKILKPFHEPLTGWRAVFKKK